MTMNKAEALRTIESLNAVGSQVDRRVRPVAWWRVSVFDECLPCVTTDPDVAQDWRDAGQTVVELGDVAAERERWEKAARAALEVMDDLPTWSNAGHACNLLRECLAPNGRDNRNDPAR